MLASIRKGAFQVAAWASEGVPDHVVAKWMALGEANKKCVAQGVAELDWRGVLYQRMVAAVSDSQTPIMHKVHAQAVADGGDVAFKFLDARFFRNGGYLNSAVGRGAGVPSGVGRDIEGQEGQAKDMPSADETIAQIQAALENAIEAARIRAREVTT